MADPDERESEVEQLARGITEAAEVVSEGIGCLLKGCGLVVVGFIAIEVIFTLVGGSFESVAGRVGPWVALLIFVALGWLAVGAWRRHRSGRGGGSGDFGPHLPLFAVPARRQRLQVRHVELDGPEQGRQTARAAAAPSSTTGGSTVMSITSADGAARGRLPGAGRPPSPPFRRRPERRGRCGAAGGSRETVGSQHSENTDSPGIGP